MSARQRLPRRRAAQRGLSLVFTLVALLVMSIAAIGLTRQVQGGAAIIGNLGFKQDTTAASASGTEQAINWLRTNLAGAKLEMDNADYGYYASSLDALDPTGNRTSTTNKLRLVRWDGPCAASVPHAGCDTEPHTSTDPVNGNRVQWVITRLCAAPGPVAGTSCARPPQSVTATPSERGEVLAGGRIVTGNTTPYFRIIVRVEGPRNTVSFTETLVHF